MAKEPRLETDAGVPREAETLPEAPSDDDLDLAHADALINRLTDARRRGGTDEKAARALLRRAGAQNRAALDRLAE